MSGVGPRTANTFNQAAPTNYVAGVGRGATGFTTRSDIGPARAAVPEPSFGQAPSGYVAGMGRGMGALARDQGELNPAQLQQETDRGDYSESNYDQFSGYGERLFSGGTYEQDDEEADKIYDAVDGIMESRRKRSREQQMLLEQKKQKNERPRIADQFADLKRELSTVTAAEWDAIPEVGDHSLKYKQNRKKDAFTPVPDSIIANNALRGAMLQAVDPNGMETPALGGSVGVGGMQSTVTETRGSAMTMKLDKMSDSVSGQTVVDPKGYLTSLNSMKITSAAEIGDIKKARILLQSVTTTNPKHGPGWIAAARVEEFAGKLTQARKIIIQGCEECPESEDVWLEAARLHANTPIAKTILANAVLQLPTSVRIWMRAAELESKENDKKAVLRRALEFVPNSVMLWKAAIELENLTDARIMLARAVECVPQSVEMWLALAKLETHENARKVLNQARDAIPTERATWITAAKLEEANGNGKVVGRIIDKMMISLTQYQVTIDRDTWIKEAEEAEHTDAPLTCAAIVRNTIHLGVEEEDRKRTWMDDVETCLSHDPPSIHTARAIFNHALSVFPTKKGIWQQAAMFEKQYGTPELLDNVLREGVKNCPQAEVLWLMAAKEKWAANNVPEARDILRVAHETNPKSEQIWAAAVKLEWKTKQYERAQKLLARAREVIPSERIWMKSALLECEMGNYKQELALLDEAIKLYKNFPKFYMMAGQACDLYLKEPVRARNYYLAGLKECPDSIPLWRLQMQLEERVKGVVRARPTGELARMKLPKNEWIWLECIRLERRTGNERLAQALMSKAIQECPHSGCLWAEQIYYCSKTQQKSVSIDALKTCNNDPLVMLAVARLFDKNHKLMKARKWFERVVTINPKLGDGWVHYFVCEYVQLYKQKLAAGFTFSNGSTLVNGNGAAKSGSSSNGVTNPPVFGDAKSAYDDAEEEEEDGGVDGIDNEDDEQEAEAAAAGAAGSSSDAAKDSNTMVVAPDGLATRADVIAQSMNLEKLEVLVKRCTEAEPNEGELCCSVTKEMAIRGTPLRNKLLTTVERVLGCALAPELIEK